MWLVDERRRPPPARRRSRRLTELPQLSRLARLELAPSARARIRLGEAYRCADRLREAEYELCAALRESQTADDEHYALQHLGKTLADAGCREEAEATLKRALELRRAAGDAELVTSTAAALERLRRESELG